MRESAVENYLIKKVKALGGQVRKVKWIGRRSAPDRLALLPGEHFLAELKRSGKDAEEHQAREHAVLRWAGFRVYLLDDMDKIDEVLNEKG